VKTTNGGSDWTHLGSGLPGTNAVDLVIAPSDTSILYASFLQRSLGGATAVGVYRTADGGVSWTAAEGNLHHLQVGSVLDLAVDPSDPDVVYGSAQFFCDSCTSGGLVKTIDGGAHWHSERNGLDPGGTYEDILIDPSNPSFVYTWTGEESGGGGGGVFRTKDGGRTWRITNHGLPVNEDAAVPVAALELDPLDPDILYASLSGVHRLFKTVDATRTWSGIHTGVGTSFSELDIAPSDPSIVYAPGPAGVYRSDDGGQTWTLLADDFTNIGFADVAFAASDPAIAYAGSTTGAVYRSADGGNSWAATSGSLPGGYGGAITSLAIDPSDPAVAYVGTFLDGLFKTEDEGAHWHHADSGITDLDLSGIVIDPADTSLVYVAASGNGTGLYRSKDGGLTWRVANAGLGTYPHVEDLTIDPLDPSVLFAVSSDSAGTGRHRIYFPPMEPGTGT